jgi:hypothetical protein
MRNCLSVRDSAYRHLHEALALARLFGRRAVDGEALNTVPTLNRRRSFDPSPSETARRGVNAVNAREFAGFLLK